MEKCKICGKEAAKFEKGKILKKYEVQYYRCERCGYVFTEKPYWLQEAYSSAIAQSDLGLVDRNIRLAKELSNTICFLFSQEKFFLDWGGGYGMFVRLMRDMGYDFEWYDKYCENILAKGCGKSKDKYGVITAFELLEHLENPYSEVKEIASHTKAIVFTTSTIDMSPPHLEDWWYYTLETGQHISIYTNKALKILAKRLSMHYYVIGKDLHIFSREEIALWKCWLLYLLNRLHKLIYYRIYRRKSLLQKDYLLAKQGDCGK